MHRYNIIYIYIYIYIYIWHKPSWHSACKGSAGCLHCAPELRDTYFLIHAPNTICMHIYIYTYIVCTYVNVCIHMHVYIVLFIYIYIHTYIYIHQAHAMLTLCRQGFRGMPPLHESCVVHSCYILLAPNLLLDKRKNRTRFHRPDTSARVSDHHVRIEWFPDATSSLQPWQMKESH